MDKIGYTTMGQVINELLCTLPKDYIEKVKEMSCDDFCIKQHFELGLSIRNKYLYQNPAREKLIESLGDPKDYFLLDGDDFSHIILKALYEVITTGRWKKKGE